MMLPRRNLKYALLASLLLLTACGSAPQKSRGPEAAEPGGPVDAPLTNTYWKLLGLNGASVNLDRAQQEPHLIFMDDGQVRGHTGCNSIKGRYGVKAGRVRILNLAATQAVCPGYRGEADFVAAMEAADAMGISGKQLQLLDDSGKPLATLVTIGSR
jgi:putative lipoprotein